jgi:hypothetical protein
MAGATGLEPAASCVTGRRSNQLNYAPANYSRLIPAGSLSFIAVPSGRAVTVTISLVTNRKHAARMALQKRFSKVRKQFVDR